MVAIRTLFLLTVILSLCASGIAADVTDHRIIVEIDGGISIVPPSSETRAMLGMVRNPIDGTIYLNTQSQGLYKSTDNGKKWTASPVNFDPTVPAGQRLHGLGVSSTGTLYLLHQRHGSELFISTSTDGGTAWSTTQIDYANLASNPYDTSDNDYNTFVELSDGTMMTAIELRYPEPEVQDYLGSPERCGFHETIIRSTDGGKTWGDPTLMHRFVAETSMAIDPNDSTHILAMTRIQRGLLSGEDPAAVMKKTGCSREDWTATMAYKNGILLESTDKGRSFSEVKGGMVGFYEHRGTMFWAPNDIIVVINPTQPDGRSRVARISLDGGDTWVNGTIGGTSQYNQSMTFELVPSSPGASYMTPTVEISPNHFLTTYVHNDAAGKLTISGVFWHIEPTSVSRQISKGSFHVSFAPIEVPANGGQTVIDVSLRNFLSEDVTVTIKPVMGAASRWRIEPEVQEALLKAGGRVQPNRFVATVPSREQVYPAPEFSITFARAGFEPITTIVRPPVKAFVLGQCPAAANPPVIDGKLDDDAWQSSPVFSKFVTADASSPTKFATEVRSSHDRENLYLSFRCHEPNLAGLVINVNDRDGDVWLDDSVEIFLDTNLDRKTYLHLVFNPEAVASDGIGFSRAWNGLFAAKAGRETEVWTLEVAVPWATLQMEPPTPGQRIGFEVVRNRAQSGERTQWSPTYGGNHLPQQYGTLIIGP